MELWNSSRCRLQIKRYTNARCNSRFNPEAYDLEGKGWELSLDELENFARVSRFLNVENDYLTVDFRRKYRRPADFTQPRDHIAKQCGHVIQDIEKRIIKIIEVCIKFIALATVVAYTRLRLALITNK
jgi:hypothetical protein